MAGKKRKAKTPTIETPAEPVSEPSGIKESEARIEQSGDLQGLSDIADDESESVRELTAEGQFFEAMVTSGVEDAPEPEAGPIKIHKRRVDDVPPEYTEQPPDEPRE